MESKEEMYVTKRLTEYQRNPSELTLQAEGPNSGVLVIQDEESQPKCCFGKCFDCDLNGLPFPQNARVTVKYQIGSGDDRIVLLDSVAFVPVLHQPPSSNLYYVIRRSGKHTGEACVSAKEGDRAPCCFCFSYIPNATPRPLDPYDTYQQFEIHQRGSSTRKFFATSVASDGIPPRFLRRKGWTVPFCLLKTLGVYVVDAKLRYELPDFDKSGVVVGKWYVPFLFVKEGDAKDQMKKSMYYCMTLHQRFEEVFLCENVENKQFEAVVDVEVEIEVVKLGGGEIAREAKGLWFQISFSVGLVSQGPRGEKIGLGSVVLEQMKWEEERFGWSNIRSNIKRSERFEGGGPYWKSYRCYLLVESFELRRNDGSLVLTYEFKHVDKLKSKWN
ncbi:LOW QUALITY PROTEIN: hypothetical protein HID58_021435 [Brassica napus]|uniref:Uncharacterized protein n=1 Tax=Brassica napus TaxID=3708 RepID=A0ABQ8CWE2_BRANA|nr:LOW QUALITY PROTEIN: hypothetical protein HID58_021435 [Brassica napus]